MPHTRKGYQTSLFDRYHRRRSELDRAIEEMFIGEVNMARVGEGTETLMGSKPSASTISRVFHGLKGEYEQWTPQLAERSAYAFADGTYFTVVRRFGADEIPPQEGKVESK